MKLPYWHVDAFASRPFAGNQAAVMPLEAWLPDETLQAIGEENKFAETAFVVRDESGEADWELRWFTPTTEVALCGHATLASGHVLLTRDGGAAHVEHPRLARAEAHPVAAEGYELALPAIPAAPGAPDGIAATLGAEPLESFASEKGYVLFLFSDASAIRSLAPDFKALAAFGELTVICTAPGERSDIVSRVFVPGAGIDEDSVTGAAHAVLTPFWAARLGRDRFTAHQASARGGDLVCRLDGDRAWLGGECVTVVEGTFYA